MTTDTATPLPPTASTTTTTPRDPSAPIVTTSGVKPGWKTSEFYLALAAKILSGLFAFGLVGDGSTVSRLAGVAGFVLTQLGYTVSRTMIKTAGMVAIIVFAFHSTGCGASTRLKTLDATMATLDSAEIGLMAFDAKHQLDIVADCDPKTATKAACQATLDTYRAKRDLAVKALVAAYTALSSAFKVDDDPSAASALAAAAVVETQLKGLGL